MTGDEAVNRLVAQVIAVVEKGTKDTSRVMPVDASYSLVKPRNVSDEPPHNRRVRQHEKEKRKSGQIDIYFDV